MITKLNPLPKIPFVDGAPLDDTQTPIKWIVNGDTLDAAKTKTSNEGVLNRSGVEIQQNAVRLEENTTLHNDKINEVIDQVNLISTNLGTIADEDIVTKINDIEHDVEVLKVEMVAANANIASHTLQIADTNAEIGPYDPATDPKHRTIRKDIIFIKNEMGAYPGFNVNGDVDPSSTGSGMKYKIMTNAQAISIHEARITKIEDDWVLSDVGHLTQEVADLRSEMGSKGLATSQSVYIRLANLNTRIDNTNTEVAEINQYIGRASGGTSDSLVARVGTLESNYTTLDNQINTSVTGIEPRLTVVETQIGTSTSPGSISYDISSIKRDQMDMWMLIGESGDEGMRGEMAQVMTDIGTDSQPLSIKGRLLNQENITRDLRTRVQDVETVVGNSSSGLVAASQMLGKEIYGDGVSTDHVEKVGIKRVTQDLYTAVGSNTAGQESGIYQLLADLTSRVAALESLGIEGKFEELEGSKASHEDVQNAVAPYITEADADIRYVSKNPLLTFTTNLEGNGAYMLGDSLTLSVEVSGGVAPVVYQWKKDGQDIGTDQNSYSVNALAAEDAGEYTVEVTDASHQTIVSNALVVTVADTMVFVRDLPPVHNAVKGDDFSISVEVTGGVPPYSYAWTKDGADAGIPTDQNEITFTNAQESDTGIRVVTVSDSRGHEIVSEECSVVVTDPTFRLTVDLPSAKSYDFGTNMDLSIAVTGGTTPYAYQWFKDDAEIDGETQNTLTSPAEAGVYKVEATDNASAKVTSTACTVTITNIPLAFTTDLPATKDAEIGDNFNLEVAVSGGEAPYTYAWSKNGQPHVFPGDPDVTSVAFSNVTAADNATWQVKVTDHAGAEITSTECTVAVNDPDTALHFAVDLPVAREYNTGENMDLSVFPYGGTAPYTYKWYKDDGEISGETNAELTTVAEAGTYKVEVTDSETSPATITSVSCAVTIA